MSKFFKNVIDTTRRWANESRPSLLTKAAAEFTGCMIFQFLGSVSPTATTNATALMVLVYYTAKLSGAHLNPALTTTFALLGYTNPLEVVVYWIAQMTGAIFGALWISALVPGLSIGGTVDGSNGAYAGCFQSAPGVTDANAFGWEAVGTFCFILPIFSVVWYTQSKSGYGNTGPIIVGLSLYAAASAVGQFTGGALNPARAVASSIVFRCPGGASVWSYVAGEFAGAIVVPLAIIPWYGVSATMQISQDGDEYEPSEEEAVDVAVVEHGRMTPTTPPHASPHPNAGSSSSTASKTRMPPRRTRAPPHENAYQCKPVTTTGGGIHLAKSSDRITNHSSQGSPDSPQNAGSSNRKSSTGSKESVDPESLA